MGEKPYHPLVALAFMVNGSLVITSAIVLPLMWMAGDVGLFFPVIGAMTVLMNASLLLTALTALAASFLKRRKQAQQASDGAEEK